MYMSVIPWLVFLVPLAGAVLIAASCFFFGMLIAVVTQRSLW